jgi:thiamine-phosphate pyrophosphorylase
MKGLYVIVDPEHCQGRDPLWVAEQALLGGCAALQLRAKGMSDAARLRLARALKERCAKASVPFWLNDRLDLALLADADGLHLGQDDLPISEARRLWGNRPLGLSTHTLPQASTAQIAGADMIGFGPIFGTRSKENPDPAVGLPGLREACTRVQRPVVAIGGITLAHAADIRRAGASYAAVIAAVCGAADPGKAARELHQALLAD